MFFTSCTQSTVDSDSKPVSKDQSTTDSQVITDAQTENKDKINTVSCVQDDDCILVSRDCCSCTSGGKYIAIHKSQKDLHDRAQRQKCSEYVTCPAHQVLGCNEWEARCVNTICSAIRE